ncbi:MAG: hypothetical protein ACC661_08985 [Verrucomicrobiales bacterium]
MRSKEELVAVLDRCRGEISLNSTALGEALNPGTLVKNSLAQHPLGWVAGSALFGLIGTRVFSRSRKRKRAASVNAGHKPAGGLLALLLFGLRAAFTIARPSLTRILQKRLTELVDSPSPGSEGTPGGENPLATRPGSR